METRFVELPSVLAAYIHQLAQTNQSQWPAEKLRAALAWHFSKPEMLTGGHPHDKWQLCTMADGRVVAQGNPARAAMISQILTGLSKSKKRARTLTRASPMSLPKLTTMIDYLEGAEDMNETLRLWMAAVCSLCFYGMCRINEVLLMKKGDIQFGLERKSMVDADQVVNYGCFTIRDLKTDHDPHASRTYSLHNLPHEGRAANVWKLVSRWIDYAAERLHHTWRRDEFAFPALTKIPRGSVKKHRQSESVFSNQCFSKVGVRWNSPMADNNFTQVLNVVASVSGIDENLLGDKIWYTSHCFRRGGAQYRFMFAPLNTRWSLKQVKRWAGWSPNEQSETVVRYLLDDVLDREESELGDALAPDSKIGDFKTTQCIETHNTSKRVRISGGQDSDLGSREQFAELKSSIADSLRVAVEEMHQSAITIGSGTGTATSTAKETVTLISEFADATSWRDYITQYCSSNPSCHQYRAGVDMLPEERKRHRSRLSRMRTITEFVRSNYKDDLVAFETDISRSVAGELTVNKILAAIRCRTK